MTRRVWSGLAMAIALGAITAGGVVISQDGEAPAGQANIWVDTNGGTCTRSASPADYADAAACASFDAAWDAMSAGDTARIVPGTYPWQKVTGDKASTTRLIGNGDDPGDVILQASSTECYAISSGASAMCVSGTNLWLENVTLDSQNITTTGSAARVWFNHNECPSQDCDGSNATFINVESRGYWPAFQIQAPGFTWIGGTRDEGIINDPPLCSGGGQPIQLFADDAHIEGITFHPVDIGPFVPVTCDPHVENIRIVGAADNITIKGNTFLDCVDCGSGHIFNGDGGGSTNVRIIGNYFEPVNLYICQCLDGVGWLFAYNTFLQASIYPSSASTFVGNLGTSGARGTGTAYPGCSGTHIANVWSGSGTCADDDFYGAGSPGIDATGHLEASSPAIDAAETPGASDYCTDAAYVNSVDFDGDTRPLGSVCDAGADERE